MADRAIDSYATGSMSTRLITLTVVLLALVFLAHWALRFTQIGGAQVAPSIAIYVLMALLLAPQLGWATLSALGVAVGLLTMVATSSPYPPANIPAHGLGFLLAAALVRRIAPDGEELDAGRIVGLLAITLIVAWTLFSTVSWFGLLPQGHPLTLRSFEAFGFVFGQGLFAWWIFGFLTIAIPTFLIAVVLTPLLYRSIRPTLVRRGMLPA